jgi:hypothetical protein
MESMCVVRGNCATTRTGEFTVRFLVGEIIITPAAKTMVDESRDIDMASARTNFPDAKTASKFFAASPTYAFELRQARLLRAIF